MSYKRLRREVFGGSESDILLTRQGKGSDRILKKLEGTLAVDSVDWEQRMRNGRCRLTLGPKGTGLLGGKKGIVPSHPWEGKKWKWLRDFVNSRTRELIRAGYVDEGVTATALINYYPNGSSGINYHHDRTDNCLGTVASYTFGPTGMSRKFLLRNVHTGNEYSINLCHGDWLVMAGTTNKNYQHAIETMKKSEEGWGFWRYNISIRFLVEARKKEAKRHIINPLKCEDGSYTLKGIVGAGHPLARVGFIPAARVPFKKGYYIRFKSWGNVGDYITGNRLVIGKSREVTKKVGVKSLPDFYIAVEDRETYGIIVEGLSKLQPYFKWRYPRGSRFTDRKIEFGDFVDLLYMVFQDSSVDHIYKVPAEYRPGINKITWKPPPITRRYGFRVSRRELFAAPIAAPDRRGIIWAKNSKLPDGTVVAGLNMQYPYSRMLFGGMGRFSDLARKSIETRTWQLAEDRLNTPIAIIETPGKLGKKNGVNVAKIIGVVEFDKQCVYTNNEDWLAARSEHQCDFDISGK